LITSWGWQADRITAATIKIAINKLNFLLIASFSFSLSFCLDSDV
jgi:hypothetical protein